ncbi:hypothetical protein THMIRHAS_05840 [Thiosulfatimonas sediminis]|uniref:Peptidase M14 domain-containing protein n=1 Tax=Thiosulfatimonas sediminis TaxID=2675054 RepID=A0A6F8PSV7_9GAMM|nr:M14 family zinc carboxypeptidase [Thiosulfatimonas sediminis]BBP45211.1 hypothetical protein THMIRHAS_05840 [Thiosulfatimonas sediminis]
MRAQQLWQIFALKRLQNPLVAALSSVFILAMNHQPAQAQAFNSEQDSVSQFCTEWSKKLRTIKYDGCMKLDLKSADVRSPEKRLLTYREYLPSKINGQTVPPKGKILFISGIHGDEYSAISITYLWMQAMQNNQNPRNHHWLFLPLTNPDGLFRSDPATRQNANGVDLNRNFPSPDWEHSALEFWERYYSKNVRRYPGPSAASEIETKWMVKTIERFQPDAIISVHAPYGLLDYDGPEHAVPTKIGILTHRELGTFPGSLGRYAGEHLHIPVLTLELRSAGTMPKESEIVQMWQDIEKWSNEKIRHLERDF